MLSDDVGSPTMDVLVAPSSLARVEEVCSQSGLRVEVPILQNVINYIRTVLQQFFRLINTSEISRLMTPKVLNEDVGESVAREKSSGLLGASQGDFSYTHYHSLK